MHFIACWIFIFAQFHLRLTEVVQTINLNSGVQQQESRLYNLYGTDQTTSVIPFRKSNVTTQYGCSVQCMYTVQCNSFEAFIKSTEPRRVIECSLFSTLYQTNKTLIAKPGAKYYSKYLQHEDCLSWYKAGGNETGVYEVLLVGKYPMQVLCKTGGSTIGGGWMVFQNRFDGSVSFNNTWEQYKRGFGYIDGEFWLGNELLHLITKSKPHDLLVSVKSFDGKTKKKMFKHIKIDSEENNYTIDYDRVYDNSKYANNILFKRLKGKPFSTNDKVNHEAGVGNCAQKYGGGWWYTDCHRDLMNGEYPVGSSDGSVPSGKGIIWNDWKGYKRSLKTSQLLIRPSK